MGRPSKLTPQVQKDICTAIELGATYEDASAYGGITYETFNEWRKAGAAARSGRFSEFSEAVTRAEAKGRISSLANIRAHAKKDWKASAWILERRDPDGYGNKLNLKHSGDRENPVEVHYDISDADLDRELLRIAHRTGRLAAFDSEVPLDAAGETEPTPA